MAKPGPDAHVVKPVDLGFQQAVKRVARSHSQQKSDQQCDNLERGKPASPQARKPASPQARKPASPQARKPASPQARKPASPQARKPASPQARKPASPQARKEAEGVNPPRRLP